MPNIKSAAKRVGQDERRRDRNRGYRGAARTAVKRAACSLRMAIPEHTRLCEVQPWRWTRLPGKARSMPIMRRGAKAD